MIIIHPMHKDFKIIHFIGVKEIENGKDEPY
jgi:hypothetical protein